MANNGNPFGLSYSTKEGKSVRERFKDTNYEERVQNYAKSWNKYYDKTREEVIKNTYK